MTIFLVEVLKLDDLCQGDSIGSCCEIHDSQDDLFCAIEWDNLDFLSFELELPLALRT
jgi:hypothetical protein